MELFSKMVNSFISKEGKLLFCNHLKKDIITVSVYQGLGVSQVCYFIVGGELADRFKRRKAGLENIQLRVK